MYNMSTYEYNNNNNQKKLTQQNLNTNLKLKKKPKIKLSYDQQLTFTRIKLWRKINKAPVDDMGCQQIYDSKVAPEIQKFQILVSLILSIQTKDQISYMVCNRLKKNGLEPKIIAKMTSQELLPLIKEVNFNRRKANNIIHVAKIVLEQGLPTSKDQLMKIPGIGIKIATLYMKVAQGKKQDGIGVDTHVHRISNVLGWVNTKLPEQTQYQLQKLFPKRIWEQLNQVIVGFGQILCTAKNPKCQKCPVQAQCPSSRLKTSKNYTINKDQN